MKAAIGSKRKMILVIFLALQIVGLIFAAGSLSRAEGLDSIGYLVFYGGVFIGLLIASMMLVFGKRTPIYESPSNDILLFFIILLAILSLPGLYLMPLLFG